MAEQAGDALVISDEKGNYYVLPQEFIALSKVAPEAKAAVEKQVQRKTTGTALGGGYSFVGVMTLSHESQWSHFSPDVAWPNRSKNPEAILIVGKPINPAR